MKRGALKRQDLRGFENLGGLFCDTLPFAPLAADSDLAMVGDDMGLYLKYNREDAEVKWQESKQRVDLVEIDIGLCGRAKQIKLFCVFRRYF